MNTELETFGSTGEARLKLLQWIEEALGREGRLVTVTAEFEPNGTTLKVQVQAGHRTFSWTLTDFRHQTRRRVRNSAEWIAERYFEEVPPDL